MGSSFDMYQFQLATLCYIKRNNKTLMLLRNKKKKDWHKGKWNGLGGKFNPGETPEECVIREVREESGLRVNSPKLNGVITFPEFTPGKDWFVFVYTCSRFSGKLIDSREGHLEWIPDQKLTQLSLWKGDKIFMRWLIKKPFFTANFIYKNKKFIRHSVKFY